MTKIHSLKIHPAIGIARIGNAQDNGKASSQRDDFFVGPVRPGIPDVPKDGYKLEGQIKRQAAEFRIFAYDAQGNMITEITAEDAEITWTVRLANQKASWLTFDGQKTGTNRNANVKGEERKQLNICPSAQSLTGSNKGPKRFDDGSFTAFDPKSGKSKTTN